MQHQHVVMMSGGITSWAAAREIADRYVHEGARLVRLVTTVHPAEETS